MTFRHRTPLNHFFPSKARSLALIQEPIRSALTGLCRGELPWPLLIVSPPGLGKTCAGLALVDHAGGFFYKLEDLRDELIRADKGRLVHPETSRVIYPEALWRELFAASLVVVDELGVGEKASDFTYSTLKKLLDHREGKPSVYLSNLGLADLKRLYDERITSRLWAGTSLIIKGRDRRLAGGQTPRKPADEPPAGDRPS